MWVAGHGGMVGSLPIRRLAVEECEVLTVDRITIDLTDRAAVRGWMDRQHPQAVIVAAARVGGILANSTRPVDFLLDNLLIETAVIEAAHDYAAEKLLYLGSSCIYPRLAPQPIREDALLTGPLETTNESYALAKIAGIRLTQSYREQYGSDFIGAMQTNLYRPGDNYDARCEPCSARADRQGRHGSAGRHPGHHLGLGHAGPRVLYIDDCADACVHLLAHYSGATPLNIGAGQDISILELTRLVM